MARRYTWDAKKNLVNRRKHRIGFETAALVFDDPRAISFQDLDVDGEQRWQTIVGRLVWRSLLWPTLSPKAALMRLYASSLHEKRHRTETL